ncbi:MAG: MFS transporter [Rhodospirillales bacterium]
MPKRLITISVIAMLVQQALATMGGLIVPVIAPAIIAERGLNPALVGAFTAVTYASAMAGTLIGGAFLLRYGALRLSQACIVLTGLGLFAAGSGWLPLLVAAAVLVGLGSGPSTPASSHILARVSPPKIAPIIFSIKQTGVPLGGVLAGAASAVLVAPLGWRGTLLVAAAVCAVFVVLVQPFRATIDDDRSPGRSLSLQDVRRPIRAVLWEPRIRELAIASYTFTGMQIAYGSFLVVYLTHALDYSPTLAGTIFAIGQGVAMGSRIVLGWVASRFVDARLLLGGLGIAMALALGAVGLSTASWPVAAVLAACVAFGLTGLSFQGILLAEIARCSPPGQAGLITGGVVVCAYFSMVSYPAAIAAWIGATGAYDVAFIMAGVPALLVGIRILAVRR